MAEVGDGIDLYADVEDFGQVFHQFLSCILINVNLLFVRGLWEDNMYFKSAT